MENREHGERPIVIGEPVESDIRGVQEVFYKAWLDTYPNEKAGITRDDIEERFKGSFTEEALKKRWERISSTKGEKLILAKEGEKVVGLIRLAFPEGKNQLQAIYILPDYHRKGIGTMLWNEAKKYFDPKKPTIVQVADYNDRAIAFYEKLGFKDNGRRWNDEKLRMKSGSIMGQLEMEMPARES